MTETSLERLRYLKEKLCIEDPNEDHIVSPGGMITIWLNINPPTATRLIAQHNSLNRCENEDRIFDYSRAMSKEEWEESHQGICLDKNLMLVDGQTRCGGIVQSNTTQMIMVTFDAKPEIRLDVDDVRKRMEHDSFKLVGIDTTRDSVRVLTRTLNIEGKRKGRIRLTRREKISLFKYLSNSIGITCKLLLVGGAMKLRATTIHRVALVRALHSNLISENDARAFIKILLNGLEESAEYSERDKIPQHLRTSILQMNLDPSWNRTAKDVTQYYLMEYCLEHFAKNKPVDKYPSPKTLLSEGERIPIDIDDPQFRKYVVENVISIEKETPALRLAV